MRAKAPSAQRGYGRTHRAVRKQFEPLVRSGEAVCPKCGKLIAPSALWDLGHTDDRKGWTGPEHQSCNRSAGAREGNRRRAEHHDPPPPPGW